MLKFASHVLFFNQDRYILKNISMIAPHVEKIYVSLSETPWTYNINARNEFKNLSNPEIFKNSEFYDKIEIIRGNWDLDEDQRNTCLNKAKKDGIDILFIIDADEFYHDYDLNKIKEEISNNSNYEYYLINRITFWKNPNYILINKNDKIHVEYPEIAINLNENTNFIRCRKCRGGKFKILNYTCYHMSYVLSDDECWSKINTWGHTHQIKNKEKWYNEKWLNWNENVLNLHPVKPTEWKKAIKLTSDFNLPEIIKK